jgi:hypothetical protein
VRWFVVLALGTGVVVGACTLLEDDLPTNACKNTNDCFRAQGEHCDVMRHVCVPVDAGVDAP